MDEVRSVLQADNVAATGRGVRIAILDTGADGEHPDFATCINRKDSRTFCLAAYDELADYNGHGTHIAGIIAGSGQVSDGLYRGIAPEAELIVLRVLEATGLGRDSIVADGVYYALELDVDIINYSAGQRAGSRVPAPPWKWSRALSFRDEAFLAAAEKGVLCVAAAGNEALFSMSAEDRQAGASVIRPGNLRDVLCVGATRPPHDSVDATSGRGPVYVDDGLPKNAIVAPFWKQSGPNGRVDRPEPYLKPDVVAPGGIVDEGLVAESITRFVHGGIVSTRSRKGMMVGLDPNDPAAPYARCHGSSQATAVITGLAALLLQQIRATSVPLGANMGHALRQIIRHSARPLPLGSSADFGHGFVTWQRIIETLEACRTSEVFRKTVLEGPQLELL